MRRFRDWRQVKALGVCCLASMAVACERGGRAAGPSEAPGEVCCEVRVSDLTSRFLIFYDTAMREEADEARRWELWKEHYDFAALPPVPARDSLARAMLVAAWPRYPEVIPRIRAGADSLRPPPDSVLRLVAQRLAATEPIPVHLVLFVGDLEGGAFFVPDENALNVALPIEEPTLRRTHGMAHEFAHAVHHHLAGLGNGWERSIARTVFSEGLANRAVQAIFPGLADADYVEHRPGWFGEAEEHGQEILAGLLPHLGYSDSEQVMRFTMGQGATGLEREAYYAGWIVVGHLLNHGYSFAELARVPEVELPALVAGAIEQLVAGVEHP